MKNFKVFLNDKGNEIIEHLKSIGYDSDDTFFDASHSFIYAKGVVFSSGNNNTQFQKSDLPRLTAYEVLALKPELKFKPFDKVLVRGSNSLAWQATMFSRMEKEHYICVGLSVWSQCIPYEGNEHLHGTTQNPE